MDSVKPIMAGYANRRETAIFFGHPLQLRMTRRGPNGTATVGIETDEHETREQACNRARRLLDISETK